jgi:hypothetical protein
MFPAEEYWQRADEAQMRMLQCRHPTARAHLEKITRMWREMAEHADRLGAGPPATGRHGVDDPYLDAGAH